MELIGERYDKYHSFTFPKRPFPFSFYNFWVFLPWREVWLFNYYFLLEILDIDLFIWNFYFNYFSYFSLDFYILCLLDLFFIDHWSGKYFSLYCILNYIFSVSFLLWGGFSVFAFYLFINFFITIYFYTISGFLYFLVLHSIFLLISL